MAVKRNLGMGLDLLLTAGEGNTSLDRDSSNINGAASLMAKAIEEDEQGNIFEAYHLYRQVIDCQAKPALRALPAMSALAAQALNNVAVILCENGKPESAQTFLTQALHPQPDHQVALENLQLIRLASGS